MIKWLMVLASLSLVACEDCTEEWFVGECVDGTQSMGFVNSCTGEPIALFEQRCGMPDGGVDAGMPVGYWDDRTSEQVVVSGRFAQMSATADGAGLWLADASRRMLEARRQIRERRRSARTG